MNNECTPRPTVSVVMCTYNGERFLREQLESILEQDYPLHELIVQDDGSTDGTWALIRDYAERYPQLIRPFQNAERLGFNANFRTAMERATGKLIAIADQDDIWLPQKIRRQVETIGEADLCISDYFTDPAYVMPLHVRVSPSTRFEHAIFYSGTPGHTMLLRRDFVGGITHWDYFIYYDWWLSFHAHLGRGVVKVAEPLNWHRHHAGSATTRILKKGRWEPVAHPTWQPYAYGYLHRLHLQRKGNYQRLYTYLAEHIDARRQPVPARLARLMLRRSPWALLELCLLCCKHKDRVLPRHIGGLKGRFRGFFYPLIAAYGCDLFKLEPSPNP